MPFNVMQADTLEFVTALYDDAGNISVPPVGIYLQVFYYDTNEAIQTGTVFLTGINEYFVGNWTIPNTMQGTAVMQLALTADGKFPLSVLPDPYLRSPGVSGPPPIPPPPSIPTPPLLVFPIFFIDDLGVSSFIDDLGVSSFIDDAGVNLQ